jgi:hypothetical protein
VWCALCLSYVSTTCTWLELSQKKEMHENFEEMKKEYNVKFDTPLSDEDIMDIGGHDQMSDQ